MRISTELLQQLVLVELCRIMIKKEKDEKDMVIYQASPRRYSRQLSVEQGLDLQKRKDTIEVWKGLNSITKDGG